MPDWRSSMQETYEYYIVDPGTWRDKQLITTAKTCSITRDSEVDTLGSATIDITGSIGECYVRVYLVTFQNGVRERFPLGTFLLQTPSDSFNGKVRSVSVDAYTPLIELKENPPPLGYSVLKGENVMSNAYRLCREHVRAPVVETSCDKVLYSNFIANTSDTWLTYTKDLISNAKHVFDLDEMGRILFAPKQDIASMQPVWTYTDDDRSILYPEISSNHDLYGIPNIVEIVYTNGFYNEDTKLTEYSLQIRNDDPNSPTSVANRGREILHREINPNIAGDGILVTKKVVENYATSLLRTLSSLEYTISYTHGYCPVRVGDCVRINYRKADLIDIKAKVISQTIKCEPGCPVTEKAVFTKKLWG